MRAADDFHALGHGLFGWSAYDPTVKVDLHAHAVLVANHGLVFIDPVPLRTEALAELLDAAGRPETRSVLLTNGNHARAAGWFRDQSGVPVFAPAGAHAALGADGLKPDGDAAQGEALMAIPLPGFGPGEVAYFHPDHGGTLFVGDALINLPAPYGFSVLPAKYCADPKLARGSLRALLDVPFTRILFAHGTPVLADARTKLEALLS